MKRKICLAALLFLWPVLLGLAPAQAHDDRVDAVTMATPVLIGQPMALQTAQNFVNLRAGLSEGGFPEWKGAKTAEPVPYYSTRGDLAGYCFSIMKDGRDLGHLFLSADESRFPVQEFSRAPAPQKRSKKSCRRIALGLIKEGQRLGGPVFVYPPSAGTYFTLFPVYREGKEVDRLIFCSRGLFTLPGDVMKLGSDMAPIESARQAHQGWNLLSKGGLKAAGRPPFRYMAGVPIYPYLIFCHPTVTAAFLDYLGFRRPAESREEFTAEVAKYLRERELGGLTIYNIPRRIREIAAARGSQLRVDVRCRASAKPEERITFSDYKARIDRGEPVIVIFSFGSSAGKDLAAADAQLIQYPCVGVGYSCDPTGDYLILHESLVNNELPENIIQGSSPYSRTGVVFINWEATCGNLIVISAAKEK